jgi:hypothetical protein
LHHEEQHYNPTNARNKADKKPPATPTRVVKSAHRHSYAWNKDAKRIDALQYAGFILTNYRSKDVIDNC